MNRKTLGAYQNACYVGSTMPAHSPMPSATATRVRVRWDNVMIVLIGAAVAAFAVVFVVMSGSGTKDQVSRRDAVKDPNTPAATAPVDAPTTGSLDVEDARGLVEEARSLMADARWAEATDRLDSI